MARSTIETDSGSYVNGVYTSKNGNTTAGGLNCPKGTRLYQPNMIPAIFFEPADCGETEEFRLITPDVAPDILPYYAISNYGRVMNINTGLIMKPNYKPNGYEYLCLAADNCKYGQKKYNVHRLVMKTFNPISNMEELQVDHINGNKADNYINKTMPDGTVQSNLEWVTSSENASRRNSSISTVRDELRVLTNQDVTLIRSLSQYGYSAAYINRNHYPNLSYSLIADVCNNYYFHDPNYTPRTYEDMYKDNPDNKHILMDSDAERIRELAAQGYNYKQIKQNFYPDFSESTISDIVRRISHNR